MKSLFPLSQVYKILLLFSLITLVSTATAGAQRATLVWSDNASGNEQIYVSRYVNGSWENPRQLTSSDNLDYFPSSATAEGGKNWVVWSSMQGHDIHLMYSAMEGGTWSDPAVIDTGMSSNTGVSLVLDKSDTPWIAWAGFDGKSDDIFWSRWDGGGWIPAERVAPINDGPDILPKLSMDGQGVMSVSWQSYDGSAYVTKSRSFVDGSWQEQSVQSSTGAKSFSRQSNGAGHPPLPDFVPNPAKARMSLPR